MPWFAMFCVMGAGITVFFLCKPFDVKAALVVALGVSIALWMMCAYRTRQDRDWLTIYNEWVRYRIKLITMYLHRRYHFKWPV